MGEPVRYAAFTTAPLVFDLFYNEEFIYGTPFAFGERFAGQDIDGDGLNDFELPVGVRERWFRFTTLGDGQPGDQLVLSPAMLDQLLAIRAIPGDDAVEAPQALQQPCRSLPEFKGMIVDDENFHD